MTYDDVTKALAAAGFFTCYRRESDTLICSAAEWPNVPQMANSFWLDKQRSDWSVATWAPHLYRFADEARVPDACIAWLRRHPEPAHWDLDDGLKAAFALTKVDSDDLPGK